MMTIEQVQAWLDTCVPRDKLTDMEQNEVRALAGTPGMALLIGMLRGSRQGFFVELSKTRLIDAAHIAQASVLQGTIIGVDLLPETLLELFTPAQADEGAKD